MPENDDQVCLRVAYGGSKPPAQDEDYFCRDIPREDTPTLSKRPYTFICEPSPEPVKSSKWFLSDPSEDTIINPEYEEVEKACADGKSLRPCLVQSRKYNKEVELGLRCPDIDYATGKIRKLVRHVCENGGCKDAKEKGRFRSVMPDFPPYKTTGRQYESWMDYDKEVMAFAAVDTNRVFEFSKILFRPLFTGAGEKLENKVDEGMLVLGDKAMTRLKSWLQGFGEGISPKTCLMKVLCELLLHYLFVYNDTKPALALVAFIFQHSHPRCALRKLAIDTMYMYETELGFPDTSARAVPQSQLEGLHIFETESAFLIKRYSFPGTEIQIQCVWHFDGSHYELPEISRRERHGWVVVRRTRMEADRAKAQDDKISFQRVGGRLAQRQGSLEMRSNQPQISGRVVRTAAVGSHQSLHHATPRQPRGSPPGKITIYLSESSCHVDCELMLKMPDFWGISREYSDQRAPIYLRELTKQEWESLCLYYVATSSQKTPALSVILAAALAIEKLDFRATDVSFSFWLRKSLQKNAPEQKDFKKVFDRDIKSREMPFRDSAGPSSHRSCRRGGNIAANGAGNGVESKTNVRELLAEYAAWVHETSHDGNLIKVVEGELVKFWNARGFVYPNFDRHLKKIEEKLMQNVPLPGWVYFCKEFVM